MLTGCTGGNLTGRRSWQYRKPKRMSFARRMGGHRLTRKARLTHLRTTSCLFRGSCCVHYGGLSLENAPAPVTWELTGRKPRRQKVVVGTVIAYSPGVQQTGKPGKWLSPYQLRNSCAKAEGTDGHVLLPCRCLCGYGLSDQNHQNRTGHLRCGEIGQASKPSNGASQS